MFDKPVTFHFETSSLLVRNILLQDKKVIYDLYTDPGVVRFDSNAGLNSIEQAEQFIRHLADPYANPDSIRWAIIQKESGKVIGTCGFRNWDKLNHHAEIGGNILSDYWRQGYATELVPKLLEYGFLQLHLNKVHAYTNVKNKAVVRLLDKYGFKKEGVLRDYQLINGKYAHVYVYGKLKREHLMVK